MPITTGALQPVTHLDMASSEEIASSAEEMPTRSVAGVESLSPLRLQVALPSLRAIGPTPTMPSSTPATKVTAPVPAATGAALESDFEEDSSKVDSSDVVAVSYTHLRAHET